ncbi:transmembrane protein 161B-like isoform X2 [Amphiura filiformis]
MALFGAQLILSFIAASVLQKVAPYHSLAEWLIARGNLVRYMYPKDEELKKLAGINQSKGRHRKNRHGQEVRRAADGSIDNSFTVPKNIELDLRLRVIEPFNVVVLRFYTEYRWLVDFSVIAFVVYLLTEAWLYQDGELNLSLIWVAMLSGFTLQVLFSLTALYFTSEEDGERSLCILFGFFFLVVAMAVLIVDERILEFGLNDAHGNFTHDALVFLEQQGFSSKSPISKIAFKFLLALVASFLGAFLAFPGLRYGRMHVDSLKYSADRPFYQLLLHFSFLFPLFVSLLWVKPVARDVLLSPKWAKKLTGRAEPIVSDTTFDLFRIAIIPVMCFIRVLLMTRYLQSYLNMAKEKVDELKKEAGRINSLELQKSVVRVFYYLCVVALQYVAPMLVLLSFTCLLKSTGGYDFGAFNFLYGNSTSSASAAVEPDVSPATPPTSAPDSEAAEQFKLTLTNLRNVFSPVLFRGVFTFLTWWTCTAWFATSVFGVAYYNYTRGT